MRWLILIVALWALVRILRQRLPRFDALLNVAMGGGEEGPQPEAEPARRVAAWFLAGLAFVAAALAWLECRQPYYFVEDDALVAELPGMIWQCRTVWRGETPEYNPYVMMGGPALSQGGGLYPPDYAAYAVARHLLGDEYAMLDVLAVLHILAGYAVAFWFMRRGGMGAMPACMAALCFVLSGSILIMGRCWHAFLPLVVWLPAAAAVVQGICGIRDGTVQTAACGFAMPCDTLCEAASGPPWKWMLAVGLLIGIVYHIGFPQTWLYVLGFLILGVAWQWATGRIETRQAAWLLPALGLGAALVIPMFYVQWRLGSDMQRPYGYGYGIDEGLAAMLLPYPLVEAAHPNHWGSTGTRYMGHFYYFGTLLLVLFAFDALALTTRRHGRRVWGSHGWTVLAGVALLGALRQPAALWNLLPKVPILGICANHPFRLLPFFVFFAVVAGGLVLERLLRHAPRRHVVELAVAVPLGLVLACHVGALQTAFYTYGFSPYPKLPAEMASRLRGDGSPERFAAWAPMRSTDPSYALALPHNLAMVYELPAFFGYAPVLDAMSPFRHAAAAMVADPTAAARAYGIRWFLRHRTAAEPLFSPNADMREMESNVEFGRALKTIRFARSHAVPGHPELTIEELDGVAPLAFDATDPGTPLPLRFPGRGIDVDLAGRRSAGPVVVNFLWYPNMKAMADGRSIECRPDSWGRIEADVPVGARRLDLRYEPDWRTGGLLGLIAAGASLAGAVVLWRRTRNMELDRSGCSREEVG
jgi:hypothetical protein